MFVKHRSINVIDVILFMIIISTIIIYARENGIIGKTKKNGFGCTCHGETPSANVLVAITGPDTLFAGETATYEVTISGGPLAGGGTNIAVSDGNLLPIAGDLRKESFELTHTVPKSPSAGKVTFQFNYTAPLTLGQQIIYANGNSVNLNGFNTGDQWNFAVNKTIDIVQATGIEDGTLISTFELRQNYPNPFNPSTKISWYSPVSSWQTLKVFDVLGNEIATLVNEFRSEGNYEIEFSVVGEGSSSFQTLASGIYFYRLQIDNFTDIKKMILLR